MYQVGVGFIETQGPSGFGLWQFIDYGQSAFEAGMADFFNGWAEFDLPAPGDYFIFLRGVGWISPHVEGEYAVVPVHIDGAP